MNPFNDASQHTTFKVYCTIINSPTKPYRTLIDPVWDAIEDTANLSSVCDAIHGVKVWARGVVQVIVGDEG